MTDSSGRLPVPMLVSAGLLVGLGVVLFSLPLRPTAWGGPREEGFFEADDRLAAGRWARDVRLPLEAVARGRSPAEGLAATGEALAGYYGFLLTARYVALWLVLGRVGRSAGLATVLVGLAAVPLALGGPRQTEADVGLLLFVVLLAATASPRPSWWVVLLGLPAVFAVWANAHPSALVGLAWLGVLAVGRAVEWCRRPADASGPAVGRIVLALVLGGCATCLNPDGPRLYLDALAAARHPSLFATPGWKPIDFARPDWLPWAYLGTLGLLFLTQLFSPRVFSPTAMLVVLTFGFWPLVQQRGAEYWWLVVPVLLVPLLTPFVDRLRGLVGDRLTGRGLPARWWRWGLVVVLAGATVGTPVGRWLVTGRPRGVDRIATADTPARLAQELTADGDSAGRFLPDLRDTLTAAYPDGRFRGAILAGEDQGDFLAWVLDRDDTRPVMTYNRPELLDREHWAECRRVLQGETDWWEIAGRHQVNLMAIDPRVHGKLADRLRRDREWRTVQDDASGRLLVAVRRRPKLPADLMGP